MQKVHILLVEDEELLGFVLEEEFTDAGYSVHRATDAHSAIEALQANRADIRAVVTDIRLPGQGTGWDVAHRARELASTMPIVYMSGDSAAEWPINGVPDSIMLSKPFAAAQAITAISQLLNAVPATA